MKPLNPKFSPHPRRNFSKSRLSLFPREVIDLLPFPLLCLNIKGTIIDFNQAFLDLLKRKPHQLLDYPFLFFLSPQSLLAFLQHLRTTRRSEDCSEVNLFLKQSDKEDLPITCFSQLQWIQGEDVICCWLMVGKVNQMNTPEAVTLKKSSCMLEQAVEERTAELTEANARLRMLSSRMMELQEYERRRLARELHDEVGQTLTALKAALERMTQSLPSPTSPDLADATAILAELFTQVRRISWEMRPSLLDDLGLKAALDSYFSTYQHRTRIRVFFTWRGVNEKEFTPAQQIAILRITQETLTNAAKHSGTKSVSVKLSRRSMGVKLSVIDRGRGFDFQKKIEGGTFGLCGLRERAYLVGASFDVKSSVHKGTRIVVFFPFPENQENS